MGGVGIFSAAERANDISQRLQTKLDRSLDRGRPLNISVVTAADGTASLQVDGKHLLTVTPAEAIPGISLAEQAERWADRIEAAVERAIVERTPEYRRWAAQMALLAIAGAAGLHGLAFWLSRRHRRRQLREGSDREGAPALLGYALLQGVGWVAALGTVAYLFPLSRRGLYWLYCFLKAIAIAPILPLGERGVSLVSLATIVAFTGLIWAIACWIGHLLQTRILSLAGVDRTLQITISAFVQYGIVGIGFLAILSAVGVDLRALAIVLGAFGVGIGFGLQNIAKDFISGIIMTVERPVKVGELVQVGDIQGLVMRIGPRFTEISHIDRYWMRVPNSQFVESVVLNWNRSGLTRVKVYVDVAYGSDIEFVRAVLLEAAQVPHPDILRHPPPKVKFRSFNESALNFRVVAFIRDPLKQPKIRALIHDRIDTAFRKYGIQVPFPQRELHLKLPDLDRAMQVWLHKNAPPDLLPDADGDPVPHPRPAPQVKDEYDWDEIVAAMRGPNGVDIRDRRYGLKQFPRCFLGTEAVDWLVQYEQATREEAILMGKLMLVQGIVHHVLDEHDFEDKPLFYRFRADDPPQADRDNGEPLWNGGDAGRDSPPGGLRERGRDGKEHGLENQDAPDANTGDGSDQPAAEFDS